MEKGGEGDTQQNQSSPEVLNEDLVGHFKTVREEITELAISDIILFQRIPEYRDLTESLYPFVVQTPDSYHCIDGWDIIIKAKTDGDSIVRCHIFKVENHSDIELAIRKVANRIKPQGGPCSYPETLRNTSLLAQIIISEKGNPVIYSHGGARRGKNFTGNREDDLVDILAERFGKKRTTINTYLNQSRHINNAAFNALIQADVGRSFFEECRVNKRHLIKIMESGNAYEQEITEAVSTKIFDWLAEFIETGKVRTDFGEKDSEGSDEDNDPPATEPSENTDFEHGTGGNPDNIPGPPDEEQVKTEIQTAIQSLTLVLEQSPIEIDTALDILREMTTKCAEILQMLMALNETQPSKTDEGAV